MKVFLDTEFAALDRRDPISIGLITINGETFYRELDPLPACHEWTQQFVVPLLNASPEEKGSKAKVLQDLVAWLDDLRQRSTEGVITLSFDHAFDDEVLVNLGLTEDLRDGIETECAPSFMEHAQFKEAQTQYWRQTGKQQHHALADANSLLAGYCGYLAHRSGMFKELGF